MLLLNFLTMFLVSWLQIYGCDFCPRSPQAVCLGVTYTVCMTSVRTGIKSRKYETQRYHLPSKGQKYSTNHFTLSYALDKYFSEHTGRTR